MDGVRRLVRSAAQQKGVVAAIALVGLGYAGLLVGLKVTGVSMADQFRARKARVNASRLAEHALRMRGEPGLPLPIEVEMRRFGSSPSVVGQGFSCTDAWGCWTSGREASLLVDLADEVSGDLDVTLQAHAFVHARHPRQQVHVSVGGTPLAHWELTVEAPERVLTARVPAALLRTGEPLQLTFRLPDAASPAAFRINPDPRLLGLGVRHVRITRAAREGGAP
jgi:hypothetical protein